MFTSSIFLRRATQPNFLLSFRHARMFQLTVVPMRQLHERGYNNWNEIYTKTFHEVNFRLLNAKNTHAIAWIYNYYTLDRMTPEQVMYGFNIIA